MNKFTLEENGYSRAEVNKFVDAAIRNMESYIKKLKKSEEYIEKLEAELKVYRNIDAALKETLKTAQISANNLKSNALEEASLIVDEARNNASRIVNDALIRTEKVEVRKERLEQNIKVLKRKLKMVLEQQQSVIDDLDEIEIL